MLPDGDVGLWDFRTAPHRGYLSLDHSYQFGLRFPANRQVPLRPLPPWPARTEKSDSTFTFPLRGGWPVFSLALPAEIDGRRGPADRTKPVTGRQDVPTAKSLTGTCALRGPTGVVGGWQFEYS